MRRTLLITLAVVSAIPLVAGIVVLAIGDADRGPASADEPDQATPGNIETVIMSASATNAAISVALGKAAYPAGSAEAAILARDDLWTDSLASGGLQGVLGGPLLLTEPQRVNPMILEELERVGAKEVYLLGGPQALFPSVRQALVDAGYKVERIAGADRIETATEVARRFLSDADTAILVSGYEHAEDAGRGLIDALSAGTMAAVHQYPMLLTDPSELSASTRTYLEQSAVERVIIVGGRHAVGDSVVAELEQLGLSVERIAGINRFQTAASVVEHWGRHSKVLLLDGNTERMWVAGLAAASYASREDAPILLIDKMTVPPFPR